MPSPSVARDALNIARLEYNARFNEGQGRQMNAFHAYESMKGRYGNAVTNNAMNRARRVVRQTHERQERERARRVNNVVKTAARRFINARGAARERAGKALMRNVVKELKNLRFVPINTFRVKRGRSPSPLRNTASVLKAVRYA